MLVTSKEILSVAMTKGYAVGAFNINNLETLLAIVEASAEEKSPVIVAATPSAIKYAGLEYLAAMVKTAEKFAPAPMALHLDHGKDVETVSKCIDAGFTSVMIDGSKRALIRNNR
jgi:fructose-bisphosphate aldolase class II